MTPDQQRWADQIKRARRHVTVCIAAWTTDRGDLTKDSKIVLCHDWRLSGILGRSDTMFKIRHVGSGWRCLLAGDPNDMRPTVRYIDNELSKLGTHIDETNVQTAIKAALNRRRLDKVEEFCQGYYSMTYDTLRDIGKTRFPDDIFSGAMRTIERIKLDACFIVAGFGDGGIPYIVRTTERCNAVIDEGFSVIGEGSVLAQANLLYREVTDVDPLDKLIYCLYEAKHYAEQLPSVSASTSISVLYQDGTTKTVYAPQQQEQLADIYSKYGPKQLPREMPMNLEKLFEVPPD